MNRVRDRLSHGWGAVTVLAFLTAAVLALVPGGASSDLHALWLAAEAIRAGELKEVYPPAAPVFTMTPPPAWSADHPGETLYPYLYPPLWAALAAHLVDQVSFDVAAALMRILNAALLVGTVALAWRVTGASLPFPAFAAVGVSALVLTFPGSLAIMENQPQVLVGFLVLLSLDRLKSDAPVSAGMALAVAAALKVYPAVFALIWLALGERRAALVFALAGFGLAMLSVALAGWPLHAAFLDTLATISRTVLLTPVSYGLVPALAQIAAKDGFVYQEGTQGGWLVMPLVLPLSWLAKLCLLAALGWIATLMRRADAESLWALLWPMALIAVSLLAPLSWAYHYIPAIAMAPAILDRLGARKGSLLLLAALLPLSPLAAEAMLAAGSPAEHLQIAGTMALAGIALVLVVLASQLRRARQV